MSKELCEYQIKQNKQNINPSDSNYENNQMFNVNF